MTADAFSYADIVPGDLIIERSANHDSTVNTYLVVSVERAVDDSSTSSREFLIVRVKDGASSVVSLDWFIDVKLPAPGEPDDVDYHSVWVFRP